MKQSSHKSAEQGLSDLLNYAHLIDEGVIINKDGALLVTYSFQGPDIHSASSAELDCVTHRLNQLALLLEDGWMLHVDELRIPSLSYPEEGHFPDSVSWLIDEERRQMYNEEGRHYENLQFLTFVWKFPMPLAKTARHWFVEGVSKEGVGDNLTSLYATFHETIERCIGHLSTQFVLNRLNSADLLTYLNTCISGDLLPITPPRDGCFIDVVLARRSVSGGYVPRVGEKNIYVLSLLGFNNDETVPGILEALGSYPLVYRLSNRFIPLSEATAAREIKRYQKNWNNKVTGVMGIIREAITNAPAKKIDENAALMSLNTKSALTDNSSRSTRFGYWTSEIVLMHEDADVLDRASKMMMRAIEQAGFACIKEEVNAFDAWLGTIPGHGSANVRRQFIHSMNLAHVLPLHSVWVGRTTSSAASLMPQGSPPVFYAATTGLTPFRFHLDVGDVGHQVVLGPTSSGKSTYLDFLIAQFLRYKDAQVFVFDKDYSHLALITALNGHYYDIGRADELSFCPLADLSTPSHKVRAEQFIEDLVTLQHVPLTPDVRHAIHQAIESLSDDVHKDSRNLTVFQSEVQHEAVRAALQFYTIAGQMKLLDATHDNMQLDHLQAFEMSWLLAQKPDIYIPVLRYIFDSIEARLEAANGRFPTLIVLEEAWAYVAHPMFAEKLIDWLKTLRKKNARVVFTTQSPSDLYDPRTKTLSPATAVIMDSCFTKIFLPNPSAEKEVKSLYEQIGLSARQIEIITQESTPKRHYYINSPEGNRLIDFGFNAHDAMALAFLGLSKEKTAELIECKKRHQEDWVFHWLKAHSLEPWANVFHQHHEMRGI